MPKILYFNAGTPSSRIALATAKAIGLDLTIKVVDLSKKEHLQENYLKLNPQHTVPTLDDDGFILPDSHAIATYLVSQYGKDDSLYPNDPKKRAIVNQRLFFNEGILYSRLRAIITPVFFTGKTTVDKDRKDALYEALGILEVYLEPTGWVAGDQTTVADIASAVVVSTIEAIGGDIKAYPKISDWLGRCKGSIRGFQEANEEGVRGLGAFFRSQVLPHQLDR